MAITRAQKEAMVQGYLENAQKAQSIIMSDYRGLTHQELTQLRTQLREKGARFQVVKNTLFKLALQQAGLPVPEDLFTGPVGVTYAFDDPVAAAKVVVDFAKETKILQVRGGLLGQQVMSTEEIESLAELPSREELLAMVVSSMQAPISGLVNVLAGPIRGLVNVLNGRVDQLKEAEASA